MTSPVRVQLSRKKGWKMPENTVKVSRPSKWGNLYKVVECGRWMDDGSPAFAGRHDWEVNYPLFRSKTEAAQRAVNCFVECLDSDLPGWKTMRNNLHELRGKNLACWCRLDQPCHADVLLARANQQGES